MMREEFEQIAGYEVTWQDYTEIIEPMYMALPEGISKQEFVKMIDKKRFALKPLNKIEKEMKKIAEHLKETCNQFTDYDAIEKLRTLAQEYTDRIGAKGFNINEQIRWTCYYPVSIDIYGYDYKTWRYIEL
jgi:hypothetical protein